MTEKTKPFVHYIKTFGRYNFCSPDKDWNLSINSHYGGVSCLFSEYEPDVDDKPPSEVLELLRSGLSKRWSRMEKEKLEKLALLFTHSQELDTIWFNNQIKAYERRVKDLSDRLAKTMEVA